MVRTGMLVIALLVTACSRDDGTRAAAAHATSSPKQLVAAGAAVVDVRTPEEFADGHLDRATNIPVDDLGGRMPEVDALVGGDRAKPVVVYCRSGARASRAKQQLEAAGYTNVVNGGGLRDLR